MAVCDQLDRATESIVTNLAKAARVRATENGIYCLECSLGSVLECAACLDVAYRRHLVASPALHEAKQSLQRIARMEVGLRHSWTTCVKEESDPYGTDTKHYFLHESLVVYQRSLQLHEALDGLWGQAQKRCRCARRVDELSTSLTVNIAEGNGRFSKLDHGKFILTAEDAGTKLAAYLDLAEAVSLVEVDTAKSHLREVMAMLGGLRGYLDISSP
jgi:four helix bundle protein